MAAGRTDAPAPAADAADIVSLLGPGKARPGRCRQTRRRRQRADPQRPSKRQARRGLLSPGSRARRGGAHRRRDFRRRAGHRAQQRRKLCARGESLSAVPPSAAGARRRRQARGPAHADRSSGTRATRARALVHPLWRVGVRLRQSWRFRAHRTARPRRSRAAGGIALVDGQRRAVPRAVPGKRRRPRRLSGRHSQPLRRRRSRVRPRRPARRRRIGSLRSRHPIGRREFPHPPGLPGRHRQVSGRRRLDESGGGPRAGGRDRHSRCAAAGAETQRQISRADGANGVGAGRGDAGRGSIRGRRTADPRDAGHLP